MSDVSCRTLRLTLETPSFLRIIGVDANYDY